MHADNDNGGIFQGTGVMGSSDGNGKDGSPIPELSDTDDNMREDTLDDDLVHAVVAIIITTSTIKAPMMLIKI